MILISGASSGIGEACARAFAAQKQDLVLLARRLEKLEQIASEIKQAHGVAVQVFEADVTDAGRIRELFSKHAEIFSKVTVLVNNAGLAKGLDPIQDGKQTDWDAMIDTNLKGLLTLTRAMLPLMLKRGNGHIVNMGSVAGFWNYPKGNVYAATKAAVRSLTESMRIDLLGSGIRVTEISPGMVETEFSQVRLGDAERAKAVYQGMQPLSAADVAEAVVWSVNRPAHVNVQEIILYPTAQASPSLVYRS